MTPADLLEATADRLLKDGKSVGGAKDEQGRPCTLLAMGTAYALSDPTFLGVFGGAHDALATRLDIPKEHIAQWSDMTPAGDVDHELRMAAKDWRYQNEKL